MSLKHAETWNSLPPSNIQVTLHEMFRPIPCQFCLLSGRMLHTALCAQKMWRKSKTALLGVVRVSISIDCVWSVLYQRKLQDWRHRAFEQSIIADKHATIKGQLWQQEDAKDRFEHKGNTRRNEVQHGSNSSDSSGVEFVAAMPPKIITYLS